MTVRSPRRRWFWLLCSNVLCGGVCLVACDRDSKAEKSAAPLASTSTIPAPSPAASVAQAPEKPKAPEPPFNVLFITVDSLRADMPWTGYEREIAPNLTALARRGVRYPNAYSIASYTAKSVATMLTGKYPSSLYRSGWFFAGYSDANVFFPELLAEAKVRSMSGHAHLYFDRGKNLNQGFDIWELVKGISFDAQTDNHVTSDKLTDLAIAHLSDETNTQGRFFAWYHYMDPHDQYVKHKESPDFGKNNRARYDSEVFFTDLHLGRLFSFVESKPWGKNTAIVISADHGEAFGEHGMYKHAFELWEVLTRVPLIIALPGGTPRTIEERRSHIDLAPTFMELLGVPAPEGLFVGKSLVPELYGEKPEVREPIVLDLPEDSHNPHRRSIIQGDYKLTVWGKGTHHQLYNLKQDPGEETELSKKEPEKLAEMKALFEKTFAEIPQIEAFGGVKLKSGRTANGPTKP